MSEGGLAVALAEMAFAGGWGLDADIALCPHNLGQLDASTYVAALLFSESNTRFVCEVRPDAQPAFETLMNRSEVPCAAIGTVLAAHHVTLKLSPAGATQRVILDLPLEQLKEAWQAPLRWS